MITLGPLRWTWEVLEYPSYSPDLSLCDYDLIPSRKLRCVGTDFRTRDDIAFRRLIMTNFSHGVADGIRRLPHRWQLTIDSLWVILKACKMLMCL